MSRPRRVLGYARVSSKEQALGTSLQDQQDAIKAYAQARGLTVTKFYVESGSAVHEKVESREQMLQLMREVRRDDLVLCDKLDRWSRDAAFSHTSIKQLLNDGVSFYAVGDQCDPGTPEGDTMLGFRILFAREEHKRIKQRMVGTRRLLRDAGYYVEGLPPIGYVRPFAKGHKGIEKNILAIDSKNADLVRRMYQMCIRGSSMSAIASELRLTRDRVHDALRNRLYLGEIENSRGEWIKGRQEPIIDAATFARAREAISSRTLAGRKPRGDSETKSWILRDIARCGRCGAKMGGAYAGDHAVNRRHYYRCTAKCTTQYVPVKSVEAEAGPLIVSRLTELREEIAKGPEPVITAVVDYADRLAKVARRRERLLTEYEDEHIDRDTLRTKLAKVDGERLRIENEAASVEKPALADKTVRRNVIQSLEVIAKAWRRASPEIRRDLVKQLASAAQMAPGAPLRFVWRSAEELAATLRQ